MGDKFEKLLSSIRYIVLCLMNSFIKKQLLNLFCGMGLVLIEDKKFKPTPPGFKPDVVMKKIKGEWLGM